MTRNDFLTPLATRLAVITLALTAVLGNPAVARPSATRNNVNRSAARPAARPASRATARQNAPRQTAGSRPNTARPSAAHQNTARQNTARPNTGRPNTARPNAAHSKSAPTSTAHANNAKPNAAGAKAAQTNTAKSNAARPNATSKGGQGTAARGGAQKAAAPATRNASNAGRADRLHGDRQIPGARFNASFGRGHEFHIGHPIMIGGQASFQFGGFWFGIVDPWPTAWLYTDAVYVDLIAGEYVLVNAFHPGVQIAVSVGDTVSTCTASAAVSSTSLAQELSEPAGVEAISVPSTPSF